jgi:hypothetical protein
VESQRRRPPAEQPAQSADALTLEQVEAVLRRAVQLEQRKHVPDAAGLSREELTRIALEAGLSPEAVEEAMRELQVGALSAERKRDLLDRLIGPASTVSARVVDRPPAVARSEMHRVLKEALLEQVDREGTRSIWVPESGARAHLLRAVRHVWTGRKDLRDVEIACDVRAADATGTRSLVSLEARISGRGKYTAAPTVIAGAAAAGTVLLGSIGLAELAHHAAEAMQVLLASGATAVLGSGIAAAAASASSRAWRQKVRRIRASLDRLFDHVAGDDSAR